VLPIGASLLVSGTNFSLTQADRVFSGIAKTSSRVLINNFPVFHEDDIDSYLNTIVDLSGVKTRPQDKRLLAGRKRFAVSVISELFLMGDDGTKDKQEVWDAAVATTIKQIKENLAEKIEEAKKNEYLRDILSRVVIASKQSGGTMTFPTRSDVDLVNLGLCGLTWEGDDDQFHWRMEEPLVVETAMQLLEDVEFDAESKTDG